VNGDFDEDEEDDGCWRCHGEGGCHDCGEDTCCCGAAAENVGDENWIWCPACAEIRWEHNEP